jgi:hypothetical protein
MRRTFFALATYLTWIGVSQASLITTIDFEGANFVGAPSGQSCVTNIGQSCKWLDNPYDHAIHRIPLEAPNVSTDVNAWISTSISYEGNKSFGARLYDVPGNLAKSRVEFEMSNGNVHPQTMETNRYYGFAVYIHPQSQNTIIKPTKFFQAWQNHDVSFAKEPALAIDFVDNASYKWRVKTSNDAVQNSVIYTSTAGLTKGVWHRFVVRFKPSTTQSGAVTVWLNGTQIVSQLSNRNFGYQPTGSAGTPGAVLNEFQVRVGAYRGRDSSGVNLGQTILMFDNLKIGTTYSSVAP